MCVRACVCAWVCVCGTRSLTCLGARIYVFFRERSSLKDVIEFFF